MNDQQFNTLTPASKELARRCAAEEATYSKYVSACLELGHDILVKSAYEAL